MRRAWLPLIVVVIVIAIAVIVHLRSVPQATVLEEEPEPQAIDAKTPSPEAEAKKLPPKPEKKTPEPEKTPPEKAKEPEALAADALLKKAEAMIAAGKAAEAQKLLSNALTGKTPPDQPDALKARLTALNADLLFSRKPCPQSITHEVAAGDALWKIAKKHKTSVELIQRLNALKGDVIHPKDSLKIIPGGFDVEVSKSQFRLTVTKDGVWIREFKVGLGKDGATPVGEFAAGPRIKEPPYTAVFPHIPFGDKKNNPLGTRWITIQGAGAGQYGIHGTWEPDSIGKEQSRGCIRMLNSDVEWLFDLIVPGQSKIVIKP